VPKQITVTYPSIERKLYIVKEVQGFKKEFFDKDEMQGIQNGFLPVYSSIETLRSFFPDAEYIECDSIQFNNTVIPYLQTLTTQKELI
jgi:hypothetical protein